MAQSQDEKAVQNIKDPKARKEAYYTQQRRRDQGTGSKESGKIAGKLGWGGIARGMAKDAVDSAMSRGPLSMPSGEAAGAVEGAGKAIGGVARKAIGSAGRDLVNRGEQAVEGAYQRLRNPTPVKKALSSSQVKMNAGGPHTPKAMAPAKPSAISAGKNRAITSSAKPGAASKSGEWHHEPTQGQRALPAYAKKDGAPKMSTKDIIANRESRKAHAESKGEVYSRSKERTPRITTGTKPKTFNRDGSKNTRKDTPVNTTKSKAKSKHMDEWSKG